MFIVIVFFAIGVFLLAELLDVAMRGFAQSEIGRTLREIGENQLFTSIWWSLNPRRRQSWFSLLHLSFGLIAAALVFVVARANAYTTGFATLVSICLFALVVVAPFVEFPRPDDVIGRAKLAAFAALGVGAWTSIALVASPPSRDSRSRQSTRLDRRLLQFLNRRVLSRLLCRVGNRATCGQPRRRQIQVKLSLPPYLRPSFPL